MLDSQYIMFLSGVSISRHTLSFKYITNFIEFLDYLNCLFILLMVDEAIVKVQIEYVDENNFEIFKSEIENALGVGRFSFTGIIGKQFSVTVGSELICSSIPQDMTRKEGSYHGEFGLILEKLKSLI